MDPRAVILLIIGGALIGASFASVPAEDRARDWPVMAAAFTGAGLVAVVVLRRRAGLPVPPGQQASPAGGAEVIQMPVKAKAAALYRREALAACSASRRAAAGPARGLVPRRLAHDTGMLPGVSMSLDSGSQLIERTGAGVYGSTYELVITMRTAMSIVNAAGCGSSSACFVSLRAFDVLAADIAVTG